MSETAFKNCIKNKNIDMFKMLVNTCSFGEADIISYIIKGDKLNKKTEVHSLTYEEKIDFVNSIVVNHRSNKDFIFEAILKNCAIYDQKKLFLKFLSSKEFKDQKVSEGIINKITKINDPEWIEVLKLVLEKNKQVKFNEEI